MSALSNLAESAFLNLVFKNIAWANIGDAGGLQPSAAAGNLYVALFTGSPDLETPTLAEATYTGYARKPIARGAGFTVSGNQVTNAGVLTMDPCTAGTSTVTYFGYYTAASGGDFILGGDINDLIINPGITPEFAIGALVVTAN